MGRSKSEDPGTTCPAAVLSDYTKLAPRARPSFLATRVNGISQNSSYLVVGPTLGQLVRRVYAFPRMDERRGITSPNSHRHIRHPVVPPAIGAMSLSLLKFAGQASLVDEAMLPS